MHLQRSDRWHPSSILAYGCVDHVKLCAQALEKSGTADGTRIEEIRQATQVQLEKIRQTAEQSKQPGAYTQSWQESLREVRDTDPK